MKTVGLAIVTLIAVLILGGCVPVAPAPAPAGTPDQTPATPVQSEDPLANTSWQLVSFGPEEAPAAVLPDSTITLEFGPEGDVGGEGGCNAYGGTYMLEDGLLVLGELVSTLMACVDEDITEQESQYLAALNTAGPFEVTGDSLTIWYDEGSSVLNFVAAGADAPTPEATSADQTPEMAETPPPATTEVPTATLVPTATAFTTATAMTADAALPSTTETLSIGVRAQGSSQGSQEQPEAAYYAPAQRIRFAPGETSAAINARIGQRETDFYVLRAVQGQIMSVEISSPNNDVLLTVVGEDGTPLKRYQVGGPSWTSVLPATQDYYIHAVSVGPATSYTLWVWVEPLDGGDEAPVERISFDPGAISATRSGALSSGEFKEYVLTASAGQRMHVQTVGYNAPVQFTIRAPGGAVWPGEALGAGVYIFATEVILPSSGDYEVTLSVPPDAGATRYDVVFTVDRARPTPPPVPAQPPEQVRFAPGATSAQRSGLLPSGPSEQAYLLRAAAGQVMNVEVTSDGVPLDFVIVSPNGTRWSATANTTRTGYRTVSTITLPVQGDYRVTLIKGDHTPSTNYVVTFTIE